MWEEQAWEKNICPVGGCKWEATDNAWIQNWDGNLILAAVGIEWYLKVGEIMLGWGARVVVKEKGSENYPGHCIIYIQGSKLQTEQESEIPRTRAETETKWSPVG